MLSIIFVGVVLMIESCWTYSIYRLLYSQNWSHATFKGSIAKWLHKTGGRLIHV